MGRLCGWRILMKHGLMVKLYKLMAMRSKFYALQGNMYVCFSCKVQSQESFWENSFWFLFFYFWKIQVVTKISNAYPKDVEAPASGVDDMTRLAYLHEPGVLQNLHSRYDINEIYVSNSYWFRIYMYSTYSRTKLLFTFRLIQEAYWLLLIRLEDFPIFIVAIWWLSIKELP